MVIVPRCCNVDRDPMADSLLDPTHCVIGNLHKTARAVSRVYAEADRRASPSLLLKTPGSRCWSSPAQAGAS